MRPLPEGYGPAERVAQEMRVQTQQIQTATLTELAREYAIFNHGAFFVYGKLDVDPVEDYVTKHSDPTIVVMRCEFGQPVVKGLNHLGKPVGPPYRWNSTLLFVAHRYWDGLRDHLRLSGWVDRHRKRYGRATIQVVPLIDFLALDRAHVLTTPLPTVDVTLFGVNSTHTHVQFVARTDRPDDRPTIIQQPLDAETAALGAAILAHEPKPFRAIESEDPLAGYQGFVPPTP